MLPQAIASALGRTNESLAAFDLAKLATLTERQQDILRALVDVLRASHIAQAMGLGQHTVRNNLGAIFQAMDVSSREDLIAMSRR